MKATALLAKASAWFWDLDAPPLEHAPDPPAIAPLAPEVAEDVPGAFTLPPPAPFPVLQPEVGELAMVLCDAVGSVLHEIHSHTLIMDDPPTPTITYGGAIYTFALAEGRVYTYLRTA